jgi:hypothetical protein
MNLLNINAPIASPTPAPVAGGTGGSLGTATYFYKVVARMLYGPGGSLPGFPLSTGEVHNVAGTEASAALASGQVMTVTIPYTGGVTHYDIYRSTTTGTEVYVTTVPAAPFFASTVFVDYGTITPGSTTAASIVASTCLPGNNFVAGGQQGGLNTQLPYPALPAVSPFLEGRNVCIINTFAGVNLISYSPDGVTAMASYISLTAAGTNGSIVDIASLGGFGRNLTVSGLGGLPKFLSAQNVGAYLLG